MGEAIELLKLDEYDFVEMYISINPDTELTEDEIFQRLEFFYAKDYCIICNKNCQPPYSVGNFVNRYWHQHRLLEGWVCGFCAMQDQKLYEAEDKNGNCVYMNENDFIEYIESILD